MPSNTSFTSNAPINTSNKGLDRISALVIKEANKNINKKKYNIIGNCHLFQRNLFIGKFYLKEKTIYFLHLAN